MKSLVDAMNGCCWGQRQRLEGSPSIPLRGSVKVRRMRAYKGLHSMLSVILRRRV